MSSFAPINNAAAPASVSVNEIRFALGIMASLVSYKYINALVEVKAPPMQAQGHTHDHEHQAVPSDPALRTKALESLLVEKGLVDPGALDALVDAYENRIGPRNGARVVARAWVDPEFKRRLLEDGGAAIGELGYLGAQGEHMVVVENTSDVHN